MASLKYDLPLLDRGTRFSLWQVKMRAVLAQQDLDDALSRFDKRTQDWSNDDKKRDRKAMTYIHLHLSNNILQEVLKQKTVAELWLKLEQICMINNLTKIYEALHAKEKMKNMVPSESSSSQAEGLAVRGRQQEKNTKNQSRDKSSSSYRRRSKSKGRYKSCKYCKGGRHDISECWKLQNKDKRTESYKPKGNKEEEGKAVIVTDDKSGAELLVAYVGCAQTSDQWILDTACTYHMCPNRDWFVTYEFVQGGTVLMGDNTLCKVVGIGTIQIKMFDGCIRTLSDVQHIPNLKRNVISLYTLNHKGYAIDKKTPIEIWSGCPANYSDLRVFGCTAYTHVDNEQMDVKTVFLHGELEEDIYMEQPEAIYLLLYVDDMLIAAKDKSEIAKLKAQLSSEFEMKDFGAAKKILGMKITRERQSGKLYISQKCYIEKLRRRFNMHDAKPMSTPLAAHFRLSSDLCPQSDYDIEYMSRVSYSSVVGSLMYAMICSRPDLFHALSIVSRYMANPGKNIGKQFSEFSDTYVILLVLVCNLRDLEMDLLVMWIQILLEIWIEEDRLQVMFSLKLCC
uniref:OO_Ba0005L10-OO_Ba0081K17.7 protein n=1 Tax=Oryza officinalis TaxID=4535 RepID=D0ABD3_9ORYZ|nr:OO_Ba0005L10-OO_Ba0081K17.7 [Oryza officinalis]